MVLNEAIEHLEKELSDENHNWSCKECRHEHEQLLEWLKDYKFRLERASIIETEPTRHGRWVEGRARRDDDGYILQNYKCSVCECEIEYIETDYNFCPYCGSKMDGGDVGVHKR